MSNFNLEVHYIIGLSPTNQNRPSVDHHENSTVLIADQTAPNDEAEERSLVGTSNTSYFIHTERTKFGLLRLAYRTHTTRIFLEESGLSYRPAG